MNDASGIHLGTSAFMAAGWLGYFYPAGMKPSDFLTFYAEHFEMYAFYEEIDRQNLKRTFHVLITPDTSCY